MVYYAGFNKRATKRHHLTSTYNNREEVSTIVDRIQLLCSDDWCSYITVIAMKVRVRSFGNRIFTISDLVLQARHCFNAVLTEQCSCLGAHDIHYNRVKQEKQHGSFWGKAFRHKGVATLRCGCESTIPTTL